MPTSRGAGFTRSGRLPMPDLLGPNPCLACEVFGGPCCCDPEAWADTKGDACGPYAAYQAKRELLEALKAGGVKCKAVANLFLDESGENASWNMARSADGKRGHLIFIPEAQE